MPLDLFETVTIETDFLGNKKQTYRLHGPAKITITPVKDQHDR